MTEREKELKKQVEILKDEVIEYIFHCKKLEETLITWQQEKDFWFEQYKVKDKRLKKALEILKSAGINIQDEASLDKGNEDAF